MKQHLFDWIWGVWLISTWTYFGVFEGYALASGQSEYTFSDTTWRWLGVHPDDWQIWRWSAPHLLVAGILAVVATWAWWHLMVEIWR